MTSSGKTGFVKSVPFWTGLTFAAFGAVMGLALSDAINAGTTMILMIVPAGLFFQAMRAAGNATACNGKGDAQRRYIKRVAIFSSAYLAAFAIQVVWFDTYDPTTALRAAIAVLPGLAVIGVFWAIGRLIVEERDEYMRMLIVRQTLIATAFALGLATLWGFLEAGDVVPHIDAYWFAIAFFFGQFLRRAIEPHYPWQLGRAVKNRLKVLRAERDWSQQVLADRLEVSRQSVNAIETGRYDPSLPLAFRIADIFEMPIEEIFLRD